MSDDENPYDPDQGRPQGPWGLLLLGSGGLICLLMGFEEIGGLPFDMPRSWYHYRAIWLGLGVTALVAGFLLQKPPRGDEGDTG